MWGVVFGFLPKVAAALSVAISGMQLYNMLRNAWRKRRTAGRGKVRPRPKRRKKPARQKRMRYYTASPPLQGPPADARSIAEAMR
jgi:hypothetical protein